LINNKELDYDQCANKEFLEDRKEIEISYSLEINVGDYEEILSEKIPKKLVDLIKINDVNRVVEFSEKGRKDYYLISVNDNAKFNNFILDKDANSIKEIGERTDEDSILNKEDLEEFIEDNFLKEFDKLFPKIIFWKPSPEYLINEKINLNEFKSDNSISIPLRNIFKLSGYNSGETRKNSIELAEKYDNKRLELQEKLSTEATEYSKKVWPNHKTKISVEISENLSCSVHVQDEDKKYSRYTMEQRSDGYKHFISILLNFSAENETKLIKNKIILLDEPEIHLHPSGIKYLRDELLKISKNNTIFVATHSIFMIDKKSLERHYCVMRNSAITSIEQVDENNPLQEEVIYEALGTSIYEMIKENIIIFEGRTDKDWFDFFTEKFKKEINPLNFFAIAATGVEKVPNYMKFLKDGLVKGHALVDSDDQGHSIKKNIIGDDDSNKDKIFEINDIHDLKIKATLEDLFPKEEIEKFFNDYYKIPLVLQKTPVMEQIIKKLHDEKIPFRRKEKNKFKSELSSAILKNMKKLKKDEIKNQYKKYYTFIEKLHKKLK